MMLHIQTSAPHSPWLFLASYLLSSTPPSVFSPPPLPSSLPLFSIFCKRCACSVKARAGSKKKKQLLIYLFFPPLIKKATTTNLKRPYVWRAFKPAPCHSEGIEDEGMHFTVTSVRSDVAVGIGGTGYVQSTCREVTLCCRRLAGCLFVVNRGVMNADMPLNASGDDHVWSGEKSSWESVEMAAWLRRACTWTLSPTLRHK